MTISETNKFFEGLEGWVRGDTQHEQRGLRGGAGGRKGGQAQARHDRRRFVVWAVRVSGDERMLHCLFLPFVFLCHACRIYTCAAVW